MINRLLFACLFFLGSPLSFGDDLKRVVHDAEVLVGVDAWGRILVAADEDKDGVVDQTYRFTSGSRIVEQFEHRLTSANVELGNQHLLIAASDNSFLLFVQLQISDAKVPVNPNKYDSRFIDTDGIELHAELNSPGDDRALSDDRLLMDQLDFGDPFSWPESFWVDLLAPGTASSLFCEKSTCMQAVGQTSCSVGGCPSSPTSCSISCSNGFHACCACASSGGFISFVSAKCACCPDNPQ